MSLEWERAALRRVRSSRSACSPRETRAAFTAARTPASLERAGLPDATVGARVKRNKPAAKTAKTCFRRSTRASVAAGSDGVSPPFGGFAYRAVPPAEEPRAGARLQAYTGSGRDVAQPGRAPPLGGGSRRFESCRPDCPTIAAAAFRAATPPSRSWPPRGGVKPTNQSPGRAGPP